MKRSWAAAVTASLLVTGLVGFQAPPVQADAVANLTHLAGPVRDVLVDDAHDRVFVSGDGLVATNHSGTSLGAVPGGSGSRQMTMSPDGTQLLVANSGGIAVVDPVSLSLLREISTASAPCSDGIAVASGSVFFSYGDCAGHTPGLAALDLATDTVTTGLDLGGSGVDVKLVSVPAAPDVLVCVEGGSVAVLDTVGGGTPSASPRTSTGNIGARDIALTPDGGHVVVADGTNQQKLLRTSDLTHDGTGLTMAGDTVAVATRADGLTGVGDRVGDGTGLSVFADSGLNPVRRVDFGSAGTGKSTVVQPRSLAFGTKLAYVVTADPFGGLQQLRTVTVGPATKLTVSTDKHSYQYHQAATITVQMSGPMTGRVITLYADPVYGAKKVIAKGEVPVSGKFQFKLGNLSYNTVISARFAGDDDHLPATGSTSILVRTKIVMSSFSQSMTGAYHRLAASPAPQITGKVYPGPGHVNECIFASVQVLTSSGWRSAGGIECLRTNTSAGFKVKIVGFKKGTKARVTARMDSNAYSADSPTAYYYVLFT